MTTTKKITRTVLLACILVACVWDVYVSWNPVQGDTISEMTFAFVHQNPTIAFLLGYVCGHLLWGQTPAKEEDHGS